MVRQAGILLGVSVLVTILGHSAGLNALAAFQCATVVLAAVAFCAGLEARCVNGCVSMGQSAALGCGCSAPCSYLCGEEGYCYRPHGRVRASATPVAISVSLVMPPGRPATTSTPCPYCRVLSRAAK